MKEIRGLLERTFRLFSGKAAILFWCWRLLHYFYINGKNGSFLHCNVYSIRYGGIFGEYD